MKYLIEIAKEIGKELRTGALVMLLVLPIGLIVAVPLVLLMIYLPDWAWLTVMALVFLWIMLGDAVAKGIAKARASTQLAAIHRGWCNDSYNLVLLCVREAT